jgi:hypothetical protein
VVSKVAKKNSEKGLKIAFYKFLERIELAIHNHGSDPEHLIKIKLKISRYLYIFI